jgi:hypothetical protein
MRRIESKKLNLHKETLRTLTSADLTGVAGATGVLCGSIIQFTGAANGCTIVGPPDGSPSRGAAPSACVPTLIPDPSQQINPSLIIGPGGG